MINACTKESLPVRLTGALEIQLGTFKCMTDPSLTEQTLTVDIKYGPLCSLFMTKTTNLDRKSMVSDI